VPASIPISNTANIARVCMFSVQNASLKA
jgi:hypothetical protein